jgi:hypothetical protein
MWKSGNGINFHYSTTTTTTTTTTNPTVVYTIQLDKKNAIYLRTWCFSFDSE